MPRRCRAKGAANPPPSTNLIVSRGREIKMIQERKKEEKGGKGREKGGKREGERGREGVFQCTGRSARGAGVPKMEKGPAAGVAREGESSRAGKIKFV